MDGLLACMMLCKSAMRIKASTYWLVKGRVYVPKQDEGCRGGGEENGCRERR